jgi:uncharacterized protein YjbI with pentapeptide repeats
MLDKLRSDCENCFGLCCVALPYGKSADFPFNKAGGDPCRNLCSVNLCTIHSQLREKGFRGCVSYECFGAGQHVSQSIYNGRDWRENAEHAEEMFAVYPIVQQLHEMLWYLKQALNLKETQSIRSSLQLSYEETTELTTKKSKEILEIDVAAHRSKVNSLLVETSKLYRHDVNHKKKKIKKDRDSLGANLQGMNLQGEDFRGKLLIGANLRNSNLKKADFIGADLRDADLRGAELTDTLFLTQSQVNSAIGDIHTELPAYLDKPRHWVD